MTRREYLENKLQKRLDWEAGRREKAATCHAVGDPFRGDIAFNTQPGHIPERARVIRSMEKSVEHSTMADHHAEKAAGLEAQLNKTIFSDDENATEALKAKIEKERAVVERMKAANKIVRKFKGDIPGGIAALEAINFTATQAAELFKPDFAGRVGFPGYALTNLGANIRRMEARIVEIDRRTKRHENAEANGGIAIEGAADYVAITFTEKPSREILDALKAAGFYWGRGSWGGPRNAIPAIVNEAIAKAKGGDNDTEE